MQQEIITERLRLINCDLPVIEAVLQGNPSIVAYLGLNVPDDWTAFGAPIFIYTQARLEEHPEDAQWWSWLPVLRAENLLVGSCGFKGRPSATGEVEMGYEVAASHRGKGLGTEMARALRDHAFSFPEVQKVVAHTLAGINPSTRILERCGWSKVADLTDPDDGPLWRWELDRESHEKKHHRMKYPVHVETRRLLARPLTLDDQYAWQGFFESEEAIRYFPSAAEPPLQRARLWMERQLGRYREGRYGMMALIHKETGIFIGQCGLLTQHIDHADELEVGYHIFPAHWRQGYATEAARAFRDLAFHHALAPSIISIIDHRNMGSQAVARNNGMTREKACEWNGLQVFVYRIWRQEWERL